MSKLKYFVVALLALFLVVPSVGVKKAMAHRQNNIQVAVDGVGDLLLYPLFYADSATKTKISVTNTMCQYGVVAKVVLRSSLCSEELRDFLIFLSPNDVWTGTITFEGGKVVLKSTDESVVFNGKSASESNPFVVSLRAPKNPNDTNQYGYIEVITLAYVDFAYTDSNTGFTFKMLMNLNGFTNPHEFMYYLYQPTRAGSYLPGSLVYGDTNPLDLTCLIFPTDYILSGECNATALDDGVLYGFGEVNLPGAYAAYRATAIKDFVELGEDPYDGSPYPYKIVASIDTPLNLAGDVDSLDDALMKQFIYIPYYDPDDADSCGSFALLFSPTMQTKYGYYSPADIKTCITTDHTSTIWKENWGKVLTGTIGIKVFSYDLSEHVVSCELSPCLLRPYELYSIGPVEDIFDPFAWSEGWMKLDMSNISTTWNNGSYSAVGLPMIPFAGHYNADGVTFINPPYTEGCNNYAPDDAGTPDCSD